MTLSLSQRRPWQVAPVFVLALLTVSCRRKSQIEYPLILVHGFGGSGDVWSENYQVVPFFERNGLKFGGILTYSGNKVVLDRESENYDFYAVTFSDNLAGVAEQAGELAGFVDFVCDSVRAKKVILVGFSMGGVTSRQYLVANGGERVYELVTIGSPHLGSPLAYVYDAEKWLQENRTRNAPGIQDTLKAVAAQATLSVARDGEDMLRRFLRNERFDFTAPAVRDLRPPRQSQYADYSRGLLPGTTFLHTLNRSVHPSNVKYSCVVGEFRLEDSISRIQQAIENPDQDGPMKMAMSVLYSAGNAAMNLLRLQGASLNLFSGGDGAVSVESQDLRNVEFFRTQPGMVQVTTIQGAGHLEECWHHEKILDAIGRDELTLARR